MRLDNSKNLRVFKNQIGQANHFLITILVGLDGVKDGIVEINDEFSTSWNPKNKVASAERSRDFAKKSALTWIVDNFDMYLRMCNEEPKLIMSQALKNEFDGNGRSVYNNFKSTSAYFNINDINKAMVDLLICWRNRLVHYKADNDIMSDSKVMFMENKKEILDLYNGLDIERTLVSFDKYNVPSFKELTSMIKSTINYVYVIDKKFIKEIDMVSYADKILYKYIKTDSIRRLDNIFSKDIKTRKRVTRNILKDYGFNNEIDDRVDNFIERFIKLDYTLVKRMLTNGSFV